MLMYVGVWISAVVFCVMNLMVNALSLLYSSGAEVGTEH